MKYRLTRRCIDGVYYTCLDIGCDDLERAEQNRRMVANKDNVAGYLQIEAAVGRTPLGQALPKWIPIGVVHTVAKELWSELRGVSTDEYDDLIKEVMKKW